MKGEERRRKEKRGEERRREEKRGKERRGERRRGEERRGEERKDSEALWLVPQYANLPSAAIVFQWFTTADSLLPLCVRPLSLLRGADSTTRYHLWSDLQLCGGRICNNEDLNQATVDFQLHAYQTTPYTFPNHLLTSAAVEFPYVVYL